MTDTRTTSPDPDWERAKERIRENAERVKNDRPLIADEKYLVVVFLLGALSYGLYLMVYFSWWPRRNTQVAAPIRNPILPRGSRWCKRCAK